MDKIRLGERVENMYPVHSLMTQGVKVLFSSDCPATIDCAPALGLNVAAHLEGREQITEWEGYAAYYAGSYEDAGACLKVGDPATFLLFDKDPLKTASAKLTAVYIEAERVR
jgi:predicted amidohydrolase YtcJ